MKTTKNSLILFSATAALFLLGGCGVKGDPLPPEKPSPLGRGQPTFQRPSESLSYPELPPVKETDPEDKENSDDETF